MKHKRTKSSSALFLDGVYGAALTTFLICGNAQWWDEVPLLWHIASLILCAVVAYLTVDSTIKYYRLIAKEKNEASHQEP